MKHVFVNLVLSALAFLPSTAVAQRGEAEIWTCLVFGDCGEQSGRINTEDCIASYDERRVLFSSETTEFGTFTTIWVEQSVIVYVGGAGEVLAQDKFIPATRMVGPIEEEIAAMMNPENSDIPIIIQFQPDPSILDATGLNIYITRWEQADKPRATVTLEKIACGFRGAKF